MPSFVRQMPLLAGGDVDIAPLRISMGVKLRRLGGITVHPRIVHGNAG